VVEFKKIADLFRIATHDMKTGAAKPTAKSLAKIESALGLEIPDVYRRIANECPNYGAYLNGIGEDYEQEVHILRLNQVFHDRAISRPALPAHFVLISHGHDGDCDCWDLRVKGSAGEHPIVRVSLEKARDDAPAVVRVSNERFENFRDYLARIAIHYGSRLAPGKDPALVAKAKQLIREIEAATGREDVAGTGQG
jgi:hypothetical protein